ncbi:MAG: cyclic nucleotide-binding domain-containing protein, partial [Spirochaetia bacterium]
MNLQAFERFAVTYQADEIVFCEYEPGDAFYLIQNGRVQISKIMGDIEKTIDVLQPGEIFGEMAILEEAPRSA